MSATGYVKSNKAAEVTDAIGNVENVGITRIGSDRIYVFFYDLGITCIGSDRTSTVLRT